MSTMSQIAAQMYEARGRVDSLDPDATDTHWEGQFIRRILDDGRIVFYTVVALSSSVHDGRELYWVVQQEGAGEDHLFLADLVRKAPRKSDHTYATRIYSVDDLGGSRGGLAAYSVQIKPYLTARWLTN